uniref:Disease resistance N-terminal domain-containing protein n=1 Tax=Leersia perrieri TaxID=77586 RepID=A0A0D9UZH1_9ORYZ
MEAMVVSSTEGAVRILLGKLADVLADRYTLLLGAHEEIQDLKDELESMNACLRDLAAGDDDHRNEQQVLLK